jgi:hypothetical protein
MTSSDVLTALNALLSQPQSIKNDKISIKSHSLKDIQAVYELLLSLEANEAAQAEATATTAVMPGGIQTNTLTPSGTV